MTLQISPFRRKFGALVLLALSATLLFAAAQSSGGNPFAILLLVLLSGLALFACLRFYRATSGRLFLFENRLETDTGILVANLEDITTIDRAAFAVFKPSMGFYLKLAEPMPRGWSPGLWWRLGRRVGIGGATNPGEGKAMAEMLQILTGPEREAFLNARSDQK